MRIAFDGGPLAVPAGGVRRYTEELARALAKQFPEDQILLLSAQPIPSLDGPPNLQPWVETSRWLRRKWWSLGLPYRLKKHHVAVFHGTDFSVPYIPLVPAVMTVHDLSPWIEPWQRDVSPRVRRRTPWLLRLRLARKVVTPTETIRRQLIERFRLPASRVVAIPLAAARVFRPVEADRPQKPYFLVVASHASRKNLKVVLEAWKTVHRQREVLLRVVGNVSGITMPNEPGLEILGLVSDPELARLYCGAQALLHPSAYEGFGLPVLEAMQCGTPVLAARNPAVEEVAGPAALYLDPADARPWVEAMLAVVEHTSWRAQWVEQALARARLFDWDRTARLTRAIYEEIVGSNAS